MSTLASLRTACSSDTSVTSKYLSVLQTCGRMEPSLEPSHWSAAADTTQCCLYREPSQNPLDPPLERLQPPHGPLRTSSVISRAPSLIYTTSLRISRIFVRTSKTSLRSSRTSFITSRKLKERYNIRDCPVDLKVFSSLSNILGSKRWSRYLNMSVQ